MNDRHAKLIYECNCGIIYALMDLLIVLYKCVTDLLGHSHFTEIRVIFLCWQLSKNS